MQRASPALPLHFIVTLAATAVLAAGLSCAGKAAETGRQKRARAVAEYSIANRAALAALEVKLSDASASGASRQTVTDLALFVSRSGGDVGRQLSAADGELPQVDGTEGQHLFNVRLFVVSGGRLYTGVKGQCGPWSNDVSLCRLACDGGVFAVRRKASAALEFLVGAIPGGAAGEGTGLNLFGCGFEEASEAQLTVKAGRGLAVVSLTDE